MIQDAKKHYAKIRWVLIIILILNWGVSAAKIIFGFLTRCESMAADGFHSLSDGASNIIGLVGIAISARPVDEDHPYGHRKYETFFSLGIAALLFILSINLAKEGIDHIFHPTHPEVGLASFIVMVVTIVINVLVMTYENRRGKELKSDFLVADAMHTKADIFTSISVIVALIAIKAGYPIIDPVVTVMISIFIAYAGYEIIRDASDVLCDAAAVMDVNKIADIVLSIKGVKACHKIRSRGRHDDICLDLHVQVDPDMHMTDAHKICYAIEDTIKKNMLEVTDVLVHIEPKGRARK